MKQKSKVDHVKTVEEKETFNQQSKREPTLYSCQSGFTPTSAFNFTPT